MVGYHQLAMQSSQTLRSSILNSRFPTAGDDPDLPKPDEPTGPTVPDPTPQPPDLPDPYPVTDPLPGQPTPQPVEDPPASPDEKPPRIF